MQNNQQLRAEKLQKKLFVSVVSEAVDKKVKQESATFGCTFRTEKVNVHESD